MDKKTFWSGCSLLCGSMIASAVILAGAIKNNQQAVIDAASQVPKIGRYQFHPSSPPGVIWRIDTTTGIVKTGNPMMEYKDVE